MEVTILSVISSNVKPTSAKERLLWALSITTIKVSHRHLLLKVVWYISPINLTIILGLTAKGLIHQMLSLNAAQRPTASQVTKHPTFWDASRTLNFFQEVSDRVEKEPHSSAIVRELERGGTRILNCTNWIDQITSELQKDLRRFRSYKGNSVRDLLRALRNKVLLDSSPISP